MSNTPTLGGKSVFVANISGNVRNVSTELRLDGANGFHKYIFIKRGNGKCMIDGVTKGFGTNTLIFVPDTCPHHIDLGINTQAYAIAIPADLEINLPTEPVLLSLANSNDITTVMQMFDAALNEYNSGNAASDIAIYSYTGLITVTVTRLHDEEVNAQENASQRLMHRFSHLVEEQFFTGKGLDVYARELGVTSTHLTRVCQKLNGQSASHFIQDRIISEARRLLLITDKKVQDIAMDLGFTSAAYFSRFFATRLGLCPKEFRKSRNQFRATAATSTVELDIAS